MNFNKNQARKKSTKIKFLGPETARWGGGLPREGVVAKNFVPALETLSSLGVEERNPGCPGNFAGMSRTPGGVQKVCAKKLRAHFSFPKKSAAAHSFRGSKRGWREGVGDKQHPKYSKNCPPELCSRLITGNRRKGAEERSESIVWEGFLAPTPSVCQPLFETSDLCNPVGWGCGVVWGS